MFNRKVLTMILVLTFGILSACAAPAAPASDPAESASEADAGSSEASAYAGETIEIIIPYGEGGGSDTWGRALAPFLQKYLGDDVTVQPINIKGASGINGANEFGMVREHDGLSLMISSGSNVFPYLLQRHVFHAIIIL